MADQQDGGSGAAGEATQCGDELVDLHSVVNVTGEDLVSAVQDNELGLDPERIVAKLIEQRSTLQNATALGIYQRGALTGLVDQIQAAVDQLLERDAVMLHDVGEAAMHFVLVGFAAEVDHGTRFRHRTEPIAPGDYRDAEHHGDDALADASGARE